MQNTYPADLHAFVEHEVAFGEFSNENDLIAEALRLYRDTKTQREQLARELKEAADSLDRGEGVKWEPEAFREFIDEQADARQIK
jgi:Arc/MetJ-type ribon-helix-helix transcriptional regulator